MSFHTIRGPIKRALFSLSQTTICATPQEMLEHIRCGNFSLEQKIVRLGPRSLETVRFAASLPPQSLLKADLLQM
jgi:hypothetical protein